MQPHDSSLSRRDAFTMLELTIVLTLIGLLMAIAAPGFSQQRNSAAVRSAGAEVVAAFSLARQTAINRRSRAAIVFDTTAGRIIVRSGGEIVFLRNLSSGYGIVLRSNRDSAVYDPKGIAYGLSNLTLTINRGGMADTLTMSRMGRVR